MVKMRQVSLRFSGASSRANDKVETSLESLENSEMPVGVPIVNSQPNSAWNYHLTNFEIFFSKSQTMGGLHSFHGEDQVFFAQRLANVTL